MALRDFTDEQGIKWTVWHVQPSARDRRETERRILADRRAEFRAGEPIRRIADRRRNRAPWHFLRSGFERGWLCFMSKDEKRRLAPPPENWESATPFDLDAFCRNAKVAKK